MAFIENLSEPIKTIVDALSIAIAWLAFLTTWLPAIASLLTIVWTTIRILEWSKGRQHGNE